MNVRERATAVETVQRCYPQIYLACHVRHVRAASTAYRLSARDSSLLVHLHPTEPVTPGTLAAHMGIGGSSLSAAIRRLARLGYLCREQSSHDRRVAALTLTAHGARARAATSVLDSDRVAALFEQLSAGECTRALDGLELLAKASQALARNLKRKRKKGGR